MNLVSEQTCFRLPPAVLLGGLLLCVPFLAGCSHPPPGETPPEIDPAAASKAALEQYDLNHDGAIADAELDKCPALKSALAHFDDHGNKRVTADTIAARLADWANSKSGLQAVLVKVNLDGNPLEGATVVYEPEKFLGPSVGPASGASASGGIVTIRVADKPGAQRGLYKVRISKLVDGKETIPAKYNSDTTLGAEIAPNAAKTAELPTFNLNSR